MIENSKCLIISGYNSIDRIYTFILSQYLGNDPIEIGPKGLVIVFIILFIIGVIEYFANRKE